MNKASILLAALVIGCATSKPYVSLPAPATDKPLARAEVRNEVAVTEIQAAKPHSDDVGQVHITTATNTLTDQRNDLQAAQLALDQEREQYQAQVKKVTDDLTKITNDKSKLEGKWYVVWGRRIEAAFWFVVVGGVLLLILHAVLDANGITALAWINPIKWVLWLFGKLKGAK